MQKLIDKQCFIDSEDIPENTATFNLNTKVLRQGKTQLSQKQIKRIAFILATDLKNFAETKGDFSNLSANAVYSHLQSNQSNSREKVKNFFSFFVEIYTNLQRYAIINMIYLSKGYTNEEIFKHFIYCQLNISANYCYCVCICV